MTRTRQPDRADRLFSEQLQRLAAEQQAAVAAEQAHSHLRARLLKVVPEGRAASIGFLMVCELVDLGQPQANGVGTPESAVLAVLNELVLERRITAVWKRDRMEYYRKPPRAQTR